MGLKLMEGIAHLIRHRSVGIICGKDIMECHTFDSKSEVVIAGRKPAVDFAPDLCIFGFAVDKHAVEVEESAGQLTVG